MQALQKRHNLLQEFFHLQPAATRLLDNSLNIYTHYDKIIGNPLGPNSDAIYIELGWQASRDFRVEINAEQRQNGAGSANTVTRPAKGVRKDFLKGVVEKSTLVGFRIVDQIRRDLFVSMSYAYQNTENLQLDPGATSTDHLARIQLTFNY